MASSTPTPVPPVPALPAKTPLTSHPTSFLDPHAYIQGSHPINLSANVVIHPRARLVSVHGPLSIGVGSMVGEKCVVGGPAPDPKTSQGLEGRGVLNGQGEGKGEDNFETILGERVVLHAGVEIFKGAKVGDGCILEARVTIRPGVVVGKGSKVCAGIKVEKDVGEGMVVWGNGHQRRLRKGMDVLEPSRLKALDVEREATAALLKTAAVKASLGKARR